MNRREFVEGLERQIASLPSERRQSILEDINLHFDEGSESGKSEESLAEMLGDPVALSKEYLAIFAVDRAKDKPSVANVFRVIWAGIGMGMLNLIFALPIWIVIVAVWFALSACGIALSVSGIAVSIASVVGGMIPIGFLAVDYPLITFFAGIAVCSLGLLLVILLYYTGRLLVKGTLKYVHMNINIISGRRKNK